MDDRPSAPAGDRIRLTGRLVPHSPPAPGATRQRAGARENSTSGDFSPSVGPIEVYKSPLVEFSPTGRGAAAAAYREEMDDPEVIRARKRRCTRAVLLGLATMAVALLLSAGELAPDLLTTAAAIVGFSLVMYGVHVGWVIFYDRETDGPPA